MTRFALLLGFALSVAPSVGCALFSRGATVDERWYTPELFAIDRHDDAASRGPSGVAEPQRSGCALRIGRVSAAGGLGLRIAYGDGLFQVGYYDGRRWTERPDQYVRRALSRAIFEDAACERAVGPAAPTLDVEVFEFEEVKAPTEHAARVGLRVVLAADRTLLERTVRVSEPVHGEIFDAFVAALARALDRAVREVGVGVEDALRQAPREATAITP